jgi:REP element-mobilizing transposase RayT
MERAWFHVGWSTFGTWLPGDPRGFRNDQHRIHSSNQYHAIRVPGEHAGLHRYARSIMHRDPVHLDPIARERMCATLREHAAALGLDPLAIAVSTTHVHLLARLDPEKLNAEVGALKRRSSHAVRDILPGRIWATRCHPLQIRDREHQQSVFRYIVHHSRKEGASVWTFKDSSQAP